MKSAGTPLDPKTEAELRAYISGINIDRSEALDMGLKRPGI
jgi:hypothetical protein